MEHSASITPKNLVICCDGTGNEISENISNVPRLDRCLRRTRLDDVLMWSLKAYDKQLDLAA